jgi:hypothetical protein
MDLRWVVLVTMGMQACQSGDAVTGEQKEFLTDSPPADSTAQVLVYSSFTEDETLMLEKYFEPALLAKLDQYVGAYDGLATAQDFEKNYRDGKALFQELYDALVTPKTNYLKELAAEEEYWMPVTILEELEQMNGLIGPIQISCAAECTDLDFLFDLEELKQKTLSTTGNADDDFIDLVMFIEDGQYGYAGYPGFKVWYVQTWDYGGYTMLGNGVFSDAVKRTEQFENKHDLFADELKAIHEDFVNSLTWDGTFGLSKEQVLEEFATLLKKDFFTKEEKTLLKESFEKIKTETEGYQFGCETGDCTFG